MAKIRKKSTFNYKYLWALLPLVLVGLIIYYFSDIVSYVLIAWVISMIGAPVVIFLRKYVGKNLAAGLTLVSFFLILALVFSVFIPPISQQATQLAGINYSQLLSGLEEPMSEWEEWAKDKGLVPKEEKQTTVHSHHGDSNFVHTELVDIDSLLNQKYIKDSIIRNENITLLIKIDGNDLHYNHNQDVEPSLTFFEQAQENLYKVFDPAIIPKLFTSILGTLGNVLIGLMSVFFIAFFFLKEQGLFNNMLSGVVPDKYEQKATQAISESSSLLIRYFIGVLSQVTVITIFVSITLSLLGVKNALLIGFFAACMNIIPYVGPLIGAAFGAIITISSNIGMPFYPIGDGTDSILYLLIKVFAVFGIMQLLDNFILQPTIFGKSVKAHPLEIFIVILVGANIGGVAGMVLAIPVYTVIRVIAKVFLSEFKVVQSLTKGL